MYDWHKTVMRRKSTAHQYSRLSKILNLLDITFLSIGTALGVGPYIFIGQYARRMGPGMVLAYLIAALVAFLSALCYAELMSRGGGSGGAYTCIYHFVGELPAIFVGWLIVLQNTIGTALSVRTISDAIDKYAISHFINLNVTELHIPFFAKHLSLLSPVIVFLIMAISTFCVKEVTRINNIFVAFNLFFFILIINVTGSMVDWHMWSLPASEKSGNGGFLPYGIKSIADNIGFVFYAYLGFDAAAHAAAECHDPQRIIPLAMLVSNATVMVLYILQGITFTLTHPYYLVVEGTMPIAHVMSESGIWLMAWITWVCVPIAILNSALSSTFPLSRIVYAIAEDGLFFSFMAKLNIRTKYPVNALFTSGILTGLSAMMFDEIQLAELTCLATLLSYSIVATCVIYLRYADQTAGDSKKRPLLNTIFNYKPKRFSPTRTTTLVVRICCYTMIITSMPGVFLFCWGVEKSLAKNVLGHTIIPVVLVFFLLLYFAIARQPAIPQMLSFKVKPHPLIPFVCILVNAYICMAFSWKTWLVCGVFILLGFIMYLTYGLRHSKLRTIGDQLY